MTQANVNWQPITEERYWELLEVLPPIYGKNGFMVSEPCDHAKCEITGNVLPRYTGVVEMREGHPFVAHRPLTVPEFNHSNRPQ